jgi:hypothetical protein
MAYIGAEPQIGNYQICDAISVVNGQAAYTMQVGSANVIPESANHMIVSLNGVIQKPGSSFTVSSSTITFASNLATGDSIDFIILLGNVLDLGVPSDSTVTTAKLGADAVTGAKIADDAIDSEHYTDGSIDTAHIADLQVTTAKIAADAITAETSVADDDLVLVSDTSASAALRKMTVSNLVANAGGGKINQVLHTDAQVNQNVSSDTELMSLAITPSASNSKIYMLFNGTAQMNANEYCSFDFYRGSLSSGTKILDGGETLFNGNDNVRVGFSMSMLDSPNTTSQVTYTVVGVPLASGTIQFGATARNTLTLMEVLA